MKETTAVESGYVCHCLRITGARFDEILESEPSPTYPLLKQKYGIGSMCSSCEYEAKGVLTEYLLLNPPKTGAPTKRPAGLRSNLSRVLHRLRVKVAPPAPRKSKSKRYHTGVFFMRRDGLESHLVVSNLRFPEHAQNINGEQAAFRATLFGEDGRELGVSEEITVRTGQTLELTPRDLFPALETDFVGGLYVEYHDLVQTGSLRPYGVLVSTRAGVRSRCHYHDKFGLFREPGFVQNSSPFEPGQTCWMALANCQPIPYETDAITQSGTRRITAKISVGSMAAKWIRLVDLFPDFKSADAAPALFWLENPQHVMVYFFWFNEAAGSWMGQHH